MTLSICTAIYNISEPFLRQCIESIISDKSADIEIILGDDCSDISTSRICREYEKADSRIRYIRQSENGGISRMRNTMINAARGKWITFIDGDDAVSDGYASCICNALKDTEFDIVMFKWQRFDGAVPHIKAEIQPITPLPKAVSKRFSRACLTGEPPHTEDFGMTDSTPSSVCIKAYRRSFINENNLKFRDGMKKSQDVEFNTRAFFACGSIGYLPQILYLYRKNIGSITNRYSADFEKIISDCIKYDTENLNTLFENDTEILSQWKKYKLIHYIINNFELNIFHKNNSETRKSRKAEFKKFIHSEPFCTFFKTFDFSSYEWHERRLILELASKEKFSVLDAMYKFPISFRLYGKAKNILK